jgi:uncharacterized RDD family membrane protein YckC
MTTSRAAWRSDGGQAHAGFASRVLAFGIDLLITAALLLMATLSLQIIGIFFPIGKLVGRLAGVDPNGTYRPYVALLIAIAVFVAYNTFWWSMIEETPGKAALGLRVVRRDGKRMTVWRSIVRSLAYWISALPLFLGFLWILVDNERQGWHDKIANTCVVYARRPYPERDQSVRAMRHTEQAPA